MDEQDSSAGLVIGIIIGGVVLAVICLGLVGGFFFLLRSEVAAPAPAVMVAKAAPVVRDVGPPPGEMPDIGPGARDRLIGVWAVEGSSSTLEIRADGTLQVINEEPGKKAVAEPLERWDVLEVAGNRLKIRRSRAGGIAVDQGVLFQDDNSFTLETAEGAALYQRRPAPVK